MIRPREGHDGVAAPPTLITKRLTLRPYRIEDLEPASAMWADEDTYRFIGGKGRSRSDIWQQIQRGLGAWALLGYGFWAVEERASGHFVGEAGFLEGLRDIAPSLEGYPEAGWVFSSEGRGKGYASEALTAMLAWAGDALPGREIRCIIEPDHVASIHIAEKAGFERMVSTVLAGQPVVIFNRDPAQAA